MTASTILSSRMIPPSDQSGVLGETRPALRTTLVHARVQGRSRLTVHGLWHNANLALALEQRLRACDGIVSVAADARTGRVVRHDPIIDASAVAASIKVVLDDGAPMPAADPRTRDSLAPEPGRRRPAGGSRRRLARHVDE